MNVEVPPKRRYTDDHTNFSPAIAIFLPFVVVTIIVTFNKGATGADIVPYVHVFTQARLFLPLFDLSERYLLNLTQKI